MNAKDLLTCSLILFSSALFAGEVNKASEFNSLDASGNGYITKLEAQENDQLISMWSDVDRNTDGFVDFIEFSAFEISPDTDIAATYQPIIDEEDPGYGAAPTE
ncbi:MAG: hypothetical protein ACC707_04345 [Thiohalomonadales bacterium]